MYTQADCFLLHPYFLDSDGNALLDRDGKFADADGLVRATATFIPEDESSDISDLCFLVGCDLIAGSYPDNVTLYSSD